MIASAIHNVFIIFGALCIVSGSVRMATGEGSFQSGLTLALLGGAIYAAIYVLRFGGIGS